MKLKEAASLIKEESEEEDEESWKEQLARRKGKGGGKKQEDKVHVDIVPIVNRKTGEPDRTALSNLTSSTTVTPASTSTTMTTVRPAVTGSGEDEEEVTFSPSGISTPSATTTTTEGPTTTTTTPLTISTSAPTTTTTQEPPTTTQATTTTTTTTTSTTTTTPEPPTTTTTTQSIPTTTTPDEYIDSEEEEDKESTTTATSQELESDEKTDILLELEDDLGDVQVEEYEETTMAPATTTTTTITPLITTERPPSTTTQPPFVESNTENVVAKITTGQGVPDVGTSPKPKQERNFTRLIWDRRPVRSTSEKFEKFAIITHHEECSRIGKKIYDAGGNSVDATIASEVCISAVHPHSTGPGFGAVMLVHSKKKNGTFIIDGRERAPKNANQNTFSINPTNAHIGYSSMGIPGWISTLWTAYKQFGSGKIPWKSLIEPTLELLENNRLRVDRILSQAFESRKNHVLHEKSFGGFLNGTTREGGILRNLEYEQFLKELKESVHAEHDFYGGHFSKSIVDEMKNRGGLISRHDLESYNCIVTRAEILNIGEYFVAGPHLPYHFPILRKVFQNVTDSYFSNPENHMEYYVDFVELLRKANQMRAFVGDDLFEPEVKSKIDEWVIPGNFKPEEQAEQNQQKRKQVPFSRILSTDDEGNAVNFMSTNGVPWGSVRRSSALGFVWNNAMSSFDVFCRNDTNCVRGGKRPSVANGFPTILLNGDKEPELLISPTSNSLETTAAMVFQATFMNMRPQSSLDHPRIYPQDQVFVETGVPEQLYRTLWTDFRAQFTHPTSPVTLLHRDSIAESSRVETLCDYRQNTRICYPSGT